MTNAIVKQTPISSIDDLSRVAKMLAISNYFDAKGDNNVAIAQIATKIMAGQEMGYGPFASVQGIHVIKGRPTLSANLMAAAVKAHPKYDYRVREMSDQLVVIEFFEGGESLGKSSFSIAEATKAGTQNMDKFPRNMLFARAMSNGVRWYCPDVFNGNTVYTPEEFDVTVDASTGAIISDATTGKKVVETGEIIQVSPQAALPSVVQEAAEVAELAATVNATVTAPKEDPALMKARKAFHATIVDTFPKDDIDPARHWFVEKYTTAYTAGNVRTSTNDLTAAELDAMTTALKQRAKHYRDQWIVAKTAPIPADKSAQPVAV